MSDSKDTGAAAMPAAPAADAASTSNEQQISLSLPEPAAIEPSINATPASEAPKPLDKPIEMAKVIEMPKPVEAVMKAAEAMKSEQAAKAPVAPLEELAAVAPPARPIADEPRSNRFAMLAASVAFAGALGAMAGALGTSVFARPQPAAETPMAAIDLTAVRDTIASLRTELGAIKSSVDSSNRNASAQFAKFTERLERIDRAQAAPAAQLKQAMEAIDRLEKRTQAQGGQTTGSIQPQQAAAVAPATAAVAAAEPARARVIDGWTVRHVSRGVAVIQGRRIGAIEVEAGDIVPGVGRIEFDPPPGRTLGRAHVERHDHLADGALSATPHFHEYAMPGPTPGHCLLAACRHSACVRRDRVLGI